MNPIRLALLASLLILSTPSSAQTPVGKHASDPSTDQSKIPVTENPCLAPQSGFNDEWVHRQTHLLSQMPASESRFVLDCFLSKAKLITGTQFAYIATLIPHVAFPLLSRMITEQGFAPFIDVDLSFLVNNPELKKEESLQVITAILKARVSKRLMTSKDANLFHDVLKRIAPDQSPESIARVVPLFEDALEPAAKNNHTNSLHLSLALNGFNYLTAQIPVFESRHRGSREDKAEAIKSIRDAVDGAKSRLIKKAIAAGNIYKIVIPEEALTAPYVGF